MIETDENVRRAREHVTKLAKEIETLADAGGPPETFFPQFLTRLVSVLGAQAGAIWLLDGQRRLGLVAEVNLATTGFFERREASALNEKMLSDVIETGQAVVRATDSEEDFQPPTNNVFLLAALQKGRDCVGVVQIFQRPNSPRDARPGYLQFMEQMCGHASRYLQDRDTAKTAADPIDFWKQFERFLLQVQRGLDTSEIATTVANDGRQLIQCDRVSVTLRRHGKTRVIALSGSADMNRRANLIRAMEKMADSVIAAGEPLLYNGQLDQYPPQIERPLADYIQESGSRLVYVLPLLETEPLVRPEEEDQARTGKVLARPRARFGALVVEQVTEGRIRPAFKERSALIAEHAAAALHNTLSHEQLFLLPVWRFLGQVLERIRGRTLYKVVAATALLLAVAVAFVFVPWDYRVEGKGRLMPMLQRKVFATWDGEVVDILVDSGEHVNQGQPLVRLRNEELRGKQLTAHNELNEKRQLLYALQAQMDEAIRKASHDDEIQLEGKLVQTQVEIKGAEVTSKLLDDQIALLTVKSPLSGTVATFQLQQMLKNRPVQRGEVLLEVMDEKGPWHLELEVPEHRIGHMLREQQRLGNPRLPVEFLLATSTDTTYHGLLDEMAERSIVAENEGSVVEVTASIAPEDIPRLQDNLRVGAEVRGKISCGPKSLGYVLFGDVIEFIQKRVLLW